MGCEVHAFLEYRRPESDYWLPFSEELKWPRNYVLFRNLAGVRSHDQNFKPPVEPRGFPEDASQVSIIAYTLYVETASPPQVEGSVPFEKAERWVTQGLSSWYSASRISHPDYHTPGYVDLQEYQEILRRTESDLWANEYQPYTELEVDARLAIYRATEKAAQYLEEKGFKTRFVFWFDN